MTLELIGRISRKLEVGKPDALVHDLICADTCWRLETLGSAARYVVVLIHAVAADSKFANERAVSK